MRLYRHLTNRPSLDPSPPALVAILAILGLASFATVATVQAEIIQHLEYTPTSLPSAQGWVYQEGYAVLEPVAYSLVDGVLDLNSLGQGFLGFCMYEHVLTADPSVTHVSARIRVRILEGEPEPDSAGFSLLITYGVEGWPHRLAMVTLGTSFVDPDYAGEPIPLDATEWHDYALTMELETGACTLLVDGDEVAIWLNQVLMTENMAMFGDNIGGPNVHAEIAAVEVWLSDSGPVAVEARTWSGIKDLFLD